jgi:hypothetical protein
MPCPNKAFGTGNVVSFDEGSAPPSVDEGTDESGADDPFGSMDTRKDVPREPFRWRGCLCCLHSLGMSSLAFAFCLALPALGPPTTGGPGMASGSGGLSQAPVSRFAAKAAGTTASSPTKTREDDASWHFACDGTDAALLEEIDEAFRTRLGYGETWDDSICNQGALVGGSGSRPLRRRAAPVTAAMAGSADAPATTAAGGGGVGEPALPADGGGDGPVDVANDDGGRPGSRGSPDGATAALAGSTSGKGWAGPAAASPAPGYPDARGATAADGKAAGAPGADTGAGAERGPALTGFEKRMNDQFFALAIPLMAFAAFVFAVVVAALIGLFLRLRKAVVLDVACPACPAHFPFVVGDEVHLFCPVCGAPCRVEVTGSGPGTLARATPL